MRTLFIHNRVDDAAGGTLTAALNLGAALSASGDEVLLSVPIARTTKSGSAATGQAGVSLMTFEAHRLTARFGFSWLQVKWIWRQANTFDIVHIHSCFYAAAIYAALICRLRRVSFVVWPHGSLDSFDVRKHAHVKQLVGPLLIRPLLKHAFAVFCTSAREVEQISTYGSHPNFVRVPLPVPDECLGEGQSVQAQKDWRGTLGISENTVIVAFIGRITPKKQLPVLIEAMKFLDDLNICLVVAGEADDDCHKTEVMTAIREAEVGRSVKMLGWVQPAGRAVILASADVFALPSMNENFGLAVVEAMMAGVAPVISPDVYLADDFEAAGVALVTSASPQAFAAAIRQLCDDPQLRQNLGDAARLYARHNFGYESIASSVQRSTRISG